MFVKNTVFEVSGAQPLHGGISGGCYATFPKLNGRLASLQNPKKIPTSITNFDSLAMFRTRPTFGYKTYQSEDIQSMRLQLRVLLQWNFGVSQKRKYLLSRWRDFKYPRTHKRKNDQFLYIDTNLSLYGNIDRKGSGLILLEEEFEGQISSILFHDTP